MAIEPLPSTNAFRRDRFISPLDAVKTSKTSDVASAGLSEGLFGATSLAANIEAFSIERDTGRQQSLIPYTLGAAGYYVGAALESIASGEITARKPIGRDEWKNSEFYREGLEYKDGLTDYSASVMANVHDREAAKNLVLFKASGLQQGLFFSSAVISSLADVKNLAIGGLASAGVKAAVGARAGYTALAASSAVGTATKSILAGRAGRATVAASSGISKSMDAAAKSVMGFRYTKKAMVADAALGSVLAGASGFEAEKVLGRKYGWDDVAVDFFASAGISVGLNVVGGYMGKMWLKTSHANDIDAVSGVIESQVSSGEAVNVRPAVEMQIAERYIPLSTLPKKARVPDVVRVGRKNMYEAVYQGEEGQYAVVKGVGATPEEAIADLSRIYETGSVETGAFNTAYTPEYYKAALNVQSIIDAEREFDIEAETAAEFERIAGQNIEQARAGLDGKNNAVAKKKIDKKIKEAEAVVDARYSQIKKASREAQEDLIEKQKALAMPEFQRWVQEQGGTDPRKVTAGVADNEFNTQKYIDETNAAPKAGDSPEVPAANDTGEIAGLQAMAIDENISVSKRNDIVKQLEELERIKKMPEALRAYTACKAGK